MAGRRHYPHRLWWCPLWTVCACGAWRPCPPPPDRIRDEMGERIPDGDRVPWPGYNQRTGWAAEATQELPLPRRTPRPWLTPGQQWRADQAGRWSR